MKTEIKVSADRQIEGNGWICYYRDFKSFTTIFQEILARIQLYENCTLEELKNIVRMTLKLSPARSKADIYTDGDRIEVCKPNKTLPHIWILKKD